MKHQWMPFFWGDFLANTMHLSAQEVGAYVLLIAHAWEHNACINLASAQRIARIDNRHWLKTWKKLCPFFETVDGHGGTTSVVRHPRVATELAIAAEKSSKRKGAAVQMHAHRRARVEQVHTPHTTPLKKESFLGEGREVPPVQVQADYRDPGNDYRAPPAPKPDLPPMTDEQRLAAMLLAAKTESTPRKEADHDGQAAPNAESHADADPAATAAAKP